MKTTTDIYNIQSAKPVKILLVDDRQENLLALEVILSNENYDLVKAISGKEALKILMEQQDFALILMDALMPIMDGFETAELIRQSKKLKYIPIIFLTAELNAFDNIFKGYQTGAVDYMLKPLSSEILKAKVAVFVDMYRKNQELLDRDEKLNALNSELEKNIQHLKESEEQITTIFKNAPDGVITINEKGIVLTWNPQAETLFGWKEQEVLGKTLTEIIIPERYRERHEKGMQQFLKTGDGPVLNKPIEVSALKKNANEFPIELKISASKTNDHHIFIGFIRDISERKKSEELLKKSNDRFLKIFDSNPIGMTLSEIKTNKITYVNKLFCTLFGYSSEEVIGHTSDELKLISPEESARLVTLILGYLKEDRTVAELQSLSAEETEKLLIKLNEAMDKRGFEVQYTRKNGELFSAFVSYKIVEIDNKRYTITSYKDITERKKNEEILNKKTQQLIEAQQLAHIGSWEWDIITNKIEWSDELYRIFGLDPQEFEANYESFLKYIHPEDKEYVNNVIQQAYKDHKSFSFFHRLILRDGTLRTVSGKGNVFTDSNGNIIRMTGTAQDITKQKQAEEQAILLIEDKNKAERAALVAEEAAKSKQQFLSNMSHEIRTPMNAIVGFTKVLLETDLNEKQKEYLNAIKVSGDCLIVLINDILDLAKVNAGKIEYEHTPFRLNTAINSALLLFDAKIKESNLELIKHYDDSIPEVLMGDPIRLRQIILNLISNAVKFTTKGSITVNVQLVKEDAENATVKLSVIDTGIGISENKIEKIFDSFQQETSKTTRLFGGTGLGLAIVKQLVEGQHGEITVKSKVGEGSSFSIIMNFKKTKIKIEPESEVDNGVKLINGVKNVKVLVAEDIMLNQRLMKVILEEFGFEVEIAGNGKIAIEKLQKNKYDVILMDVQMPEMNGIEATEYIRNNINSRIPIIALTADVTTLDAEKCKNLGMNDYLSKPIDSKLLFHKITKYVNVNHSSQNAHVMKDREKAQKKKCTNLDFVREMTKGNPKFIMEILQVYLEETPILLTKMKQGIDTNDWKLLASATHSIKPSLSTIGISQEFTDIVKKIQVYTQKKENPELIKELFSRIETVCEQARKELEQELVSLEKL